VGEMREHEKEVEEKVEELDQEFRNFSNHTTKACRVSFSFEMILINASVFNPSVFFINIDPG